jgi:hypothetical protein
MLYLGAPIRQRMPYVWQLSADMTDRRTPITDSSGKNWYEILGVPTDAPSSDVTSAVERLSRQASALANVSPDRSQQLRDLVRSIRQDLVSGQEARDQYDHALAKSIAPPPPVASTMAQGEVQRPEFGQQASPVWAYSPPNPVPGTTAPAPVSDFVSETVMPLVGRFRRFLQSGWTCQSCGAEATPADRFCTKCGATIAKAPQRVFRRCVSCAVQISSGERFCAHCGTPQPER